MSGCFTIFITVNQTQRIMIVKITRTDFENIKTQFEGNPSWDSVVTEINNKSSISQPQLAQEEMSLSDFANAGDM